MNEAGYEFGYYMGRLGALLCTVAVAVGLLVLLIRLDRKRKARRQLPYPPGGQPPYPPGGQPPYPPQR